MSELVSAPSLGNAVEKDDGLGLLDVDRDRDDMSGDMMHKISKTNFCRAIVKSRIS